MPTPTTPQDPFAATSLVQLVGGPLCGIKNYLVPVHCSQIDLEDGTSYRISAFATAALGCDTFIHSSLDGFLFAP